MPTPNRPPRSPGLVAAIGARRIAALLYLGPFVFLLSTIALVIGLWKKIDLGGVEYGAVVVLAGLGVVSAVSLRRRLEQVSQALERAQRTTTVGLVTAGFAHEMKNALTVILGFTELARTAAERPEPPTDPKVTRLIVQVRTKSGGTDSALAAELDKQVAVRLATGNLTPDAPAR